MCGSAGLPAHHAQHCLRVALAAFPGDHLERPSTNHPSTRGETIWWLLLLLSSLLLLLLWLLLLLLLLLLLRIFSCHNRRILSQTPTLKSSTRQFRHPRTLTVARLVPTTLAWLLCLPDASSSKGRAWRA